MSEDHVTVSKYMFLIQRACITQLHIRRVDTDIMVYLNLQGQLESRDIDTEMLIQDYNFIHKINLRSSTGNETLFMEKK